MNINKEVYEKCKEMIQRELSDCQYKLRTNKYQINKLSNDQRLLKATTGKLYGLLKTFK